jgi:hypothetical protein
MTDRAALEARLAELCAKQEASTGWGAAVGARHEEIQAIQGQLQAMDAQRSSPVSVEDVLKHYAKDYCEGWCRDVAPEANFHDCGGCRARLALHAFGFAQKQQQPVAWRWRPPGASLWIYDPEPSWFDAHRHEIEHEPLYADAPAQIQNVGCNPATSDIRWAVNVLLEKIAEKFEGWKTLDLWRSDAAATVRSFKHTVSDTSTDRPVTTYSQPSTEPSLHAAAEHVCWFDWSDNDADAVAAINVLRKVLASSVGKINEIIEECARVADAARESAKEHHGIEASIGADIAARRIRALAVTSPTREGK